MNGFFTVIGSVVAVILAMTLGFSAALGFAAVCYLAALGAISIVLVTRTLGSAATVPPSATGMGTAVVP